LRGLRRCTITTHDFPLCCYLQGNTAAVLGKVNGIPNTLIPDFFVHVGWCLYAVVWRLGLGVRRYGELGELVGIGMISWFV
jgi:hypothetical protein